LLNHLTRDEISLDPIKPVAPVTKIEKGED